MDPLGIVVAENVGTVTFTVTLLDQSAVSPGIPQDIIISVRTGTDGSASPCKYYIMLHNMLGKQVSCVTATSAM